MNNCKTVSDQVITLLVESGVTTFFGIPGGPISPIFDSILRCSQATLVESRQETAGAFAAATYFEQTGRMAAVVVTAGPGGTNAVTGIASAFLKKIPMLLICGDVAWAEKGERLIQDCGPHGINMESIYASITCKTIRIKEPELACDGFADAIHACKDAAHSGPALIMLPMQIARHVSIEQQVTHRVIQPKSFMLDNSIIHEIMSLLKNAQKPLVVVGNGCRGISNSVKQLIEVTGMPFVTTPQAKGVIEEDHALSLRNGGLAASWWARRYVNEGHDIDVCLALGTDLDDCATGPTRYIKTNTKLIHVDHDAGIFNRNFKTHRALKTDLSVFINQLSSVIAKPFRNETWATTLSNIKSQSPFDFSNFQSDEAMTITPHRAVSDLQAAMPRGTRYITDIGEHMLFALHYLTIKEDDSFYMHLNLGSMGSGIAGAIGLAVGDPTKPVVCICGDGGMHMVGMEILVAKKLNLPIVYAIFNDGRYNMVYHGFRALYGYTHEWDTPLIDFSTWAASCGVNAFVIRHPGDITQRMMNSCLQQTQPIVLDIRIDKDTRISGAGRNEHLQHMSVAKSAVNELLPL